MSTIIRVAPKQQESKTKYPPYPCGKELYVFDQDVPSDIEKYFILGDNLGEGGSYGQVCEGIDRKTGRTWAVKKIHKTMKPSGRPRWSDRSYNDLTKFFQRWRDFKKRLQTEISIQRELNHIHVVAVHPHHSVFEDRWFVYFVFEKCDRELFDILIATRKAGKYMAENKIRDYFFQIVTGVRYMHRRNLAHLDLKPENIMITVDPEDQHETVKLLDLGMTLHRQRSLRRSDVKSNYFYVPDGTPRMMPPEMLVPDRKKDARRTCYTEAADMWALGNVLFFLLYGYFPFDRHDVQNTYRVIKRGFDPRRITDWSMRSTVARDLVMKLLESDPEVRLTASETLDHPFITGEAVELDARSHVLHEKPLSPMVLQSLAGYKAGSRFKRASLKMMSDVLDPFYDRRSGRGVHSSEYLSLQKTVATLQNVYGSTASLSVDQAYDAVRQRNWHLIRRLRDHVRKLPLRNRLTGSGASANTSGVSTDTGRVVNVGGRDHHSDDQKTTSTGRIPDQGSTGAAFAGRSSVLVSGDRMEQVLDRGGSGELDAELLDRSNTSSLLDEGDMSTTSEWTDGDVDGHTQDGEGEDRGGEDGEAPWGGSSGVHRTRRTKSLAARLGLGEVHVVRDKEGFDHIERKLDRDMVQRIFDRTTGKEGTKAISYTDLYLACIDAKLKNSEERVWHAFQRWDKDGDGRISQAEVEQVLEKQYERKLLRSRIPATTLINEVDGCVTGAQDGYIDYAEFLRHHSEPLYRRYIHSLSDEERAELSKARLEEDSRRAAVAMDTSDSSSVSRRDARGALDSLNSVGSQGGASGGGGRQGPLIDPNSRRGSLDSSGGGVVTLDSVKNAAGGRRSLFGSSTRVPIPPPVTDPSQDVDMTAGVAAGEGGRRSAGNTGGTGSHRGSLSSSTRATPTRQEANSLFNRSSGARRSWAADDVVPVHEPVRTRTPGADGGVAVSMDVTSTTTTSNNKNNKKKNGVNATAGFLTEQVLGPVDDDSTTTDTDETHKKAAQVRRQKSLERLRAAGRSAGSRTPPQESSYGGGDRKTSRLGRIRGFRNSAQQQPPRTRGGGGGGRSSGKGESQQGERVFTVGGRRTRGRSGRNSRSRVGGGGSSGTRLSGASGQSKRLARRAARHQQK